MISVAFHTLHAVICVRTSCYCFVHIKDKSSSHLGKAVRDSTVQSSLNWHGKWKGRGKRPEEVVRCCLTTAAAASHRKYLWPKGRGVVPLPVLCPLQCCRPVCSVTAKAYASQESLRYWSEAVNHALWLHLHWAGILQAWCCLWGDWNDTGGWWANSFQNPASSQHCKLHCLFSASWFLHCSLPFDLIR